MVLLFGVVGRNSHRWYQLRELITSPGCVVGVCRLADLPSIPSRRRASFVNGERSTGNTAGMHMPF